MATVTKYNAKHLRTHSGVPYGNQWVDVFNLTTNASGVFTVSDAALTSGVTYKLDWKVTAQSAARMPAKAAV